MHVPSRKMFLLKIILITTFVVMVTSTKSQIGKIFHDTKRTPSAGNFKYGRGNMINNWCPVAKPKDCGEIDPAHCKSGVYTIFPPGRKPFDVYCKLTNQGKAWTVIQRRFDGKIDFYRTWKEYEHGFGNLKGEHWLGNDKIHILTSGGKFELRINLADYDGEARYALYRKFSVGDAKSKYKLAISGYSGNAGDCLTAHNGNLFSTHDQDNDGSKSGNCAELCMGGYWYYRCYRSNLNGAYLKGETKIKYQGMVWTCWRGLQYSLKSTTLMIRRI